MTDGDEAPQADDGSWRCIWAGKAILGEGPLWVAAEGALYWVDIKAPAVERLHLASGVRDFWTPPARIGSLAPAASGGFIAGTDRGFAIVDPFQDRFEVFGNPEPDRPGNRFNDGKVDARGRFWAGTMDDAETEDRGALYRLDPDRTWQRLDDGYRVTNGPAFSPDGRTLYHTDSARQRVFAFDLADDGNLSNKRDFLSFGEGDGYPDGMTVDADGCLWIAFWDGWCVRRFAPTGERLREVRLPVARPTSVVFGGERLDRLFVTSASIGLDTNQASLDGGLFAVEPGTVGIPQPPYAG